MSNYIPLSTVFQHVKHVKTSKRHWKCWCLSHKSNCLKIIHTQQGYFQWLLTSPQHGPTFFFGQWFGGHCRRQHSSGIAEYQWPKTRRVPGIEGGQDWVWCLKMFEAFILCNPPKNGIPITGFPVKLRHLAPKRRHVPGWPLRWQNMTETFSPYPQFDIAMENGP